MSKSCVAVESLRNDAPHALWTSQMKFTGATIVMKNSRHFKKRVYTFG